MTNILLTVKLLMIFLGSCILHELVHYFHYRLTTGKKAKLKLTLLGMHTEIKGDIIIMQKIINIILAFFIGLIPLLFVGSWLIIVAYIIATGVDFIILFALIYLGIVYGFDKKIDSLS